MEHIHLSSNIYILAQRIVCLNLKPIPIILIATLLTGHSVFSQVINLSTKWKFQIGDNLSWASPTYNDTKWELIPAPAAWEDQGYHGYDGFAWYRVKFDGRKLNRESLYFVNLGYIDDADEAYLNGELIGFSGQCTPKFKTAYNSERKYHLPRHLVNYNGENTIAIRVFDGMLRGGITDGDLGIYRISANTNLLIDLQGVWSFALSKNGERITDKSKWQHILVPSPWEFQGYKYDGFAWYKKTFELPANFTKADIVLLLGLIDDFDKVYVNGKLIGSTNDHKSFGRSSSYIQKRKYALPQEILIRNGTNTIEVLVEDMGNVGGIYEGLIGIALK